MTHYLDAIISAIRDAGQHLDAAKVWLGRAEKAAGSTWQMPLFGAAEEAHAATRARLDAAEASLRELGPADKLPPVLDELPSRVSALRRALQASEKRLIDAALLAAARPLGHA
ncbi:hypothetical protein [Polyangium jinanense]|uniref:Uncharacterized protein n=1 Tax=Polyangium jinanense TaxID=2829994 RepID=A0A9X3X9L8_9BACT|nr:hypothetical protein [Polyangium jinanense]MDC3957444.1 hypothetical protein [Polyangium jinanense]MDC3985065.1 hypothetical protein [Polyangium jinanense]